MTSERRNHGRGHSYYIDGEKVPGVTTALRAFPKFLEKWAAEESAAYAIANWDALSEATPGQKFKRIRDARIASRDRAALRGTLVHRYAEQLAAGAEIEVPEEYDGHVQSYLRFAEQWQPRELYVERPVFSRRWRYAGTPDLIAQLADGKTWLLDWKTGDKGVFLDYVLQVAGLRFAEYLLDDEGAETPLPQIDAAGIVNLRADGYDVTPIEANEQAYRFFLYVRQLYDYVEADRYDWIGDALLPPAREAVA